MGLHGTKKMENLGLYRAMIHLAAYLNYLLEYSTLKLVVE